ncbi:MAG: heavy-metal-associated domain-containing protein [Clostridia bacterium]|nr:heavy-metal-associated domain-containing protein [Clostridia bacterium]
MKRVIEVKDLCCKRCAERAEKKLRLLEGVTGAKANFKKGIIFVETSLPDADLKACLELAGFPVVEIRERKGIFG